jgi:hypothetical protein
MKDFGLREEVIGQLSNPLPREPVFLTASPQRAQPEAPDMVAEGAECRKVGRHSVVREVAPNDLRQPAPWSGIGRREVARLEALVAGSVARFGARMAPASSRRRKTRRRECGRWQPEGGGPAQGPGRSGLCLRRGVEPGRGASCDEVARHDCEGMGGRDG